jgi:hypothetical protein
LTGLGLVLRALFLLLEPATHPVADERTWTNWALEVLLSERVGLDPRRTRMIFYPPVYPYFIALTYLPFGTLAAVKCAQVVVSAALIPAVGRVGALVFGPGVGLFAAALVTFYPDLIWYSAHFWSETVFLALLWWAFERLIIADRSERFGAALAAGVIWGAAILTRETALYFTPFAALWLAWNRRGGILRGAAFLILALMTVAPWTWRNAQVFPGEFVPVSTAGGLNLWQGNAGIPRYEIYELYDQVSGRVEQYKYARRKGLEVIWERQPTWLFEKLYDEMPRFWEADSLAIIHIQRGAYGPVRPIVAVASAFVLLLPYLLVLGFFALGVAGSRFDRTIGLLFFYLVFHNALHIVTHGFARYRMPIMPVLFVFAAYGFMAWLAGELPEFSARRKALFAVLTLTSGLLVAPSLYSHAHHRAFELREPFTPVEAKPRARPPRSEIEVPPDS